MPKHMRPHRGLHCAWCQMFPESGIHTCRSNPAASIGQRGVMSACCIAPHAAAHSNIAAAVGAAGAQSAAELSTSCSSMWLSGAMRQSHRHDGSSRSGDVRTLYPHAAEESLETCIHLRVHVRRMPLPRQSTVQPSCEPSPMHRSAFHQHSSTL